MKTLKRLLTTLTAVALLASHVAAQQIISPEIHADGRVIFRLTAPNAQAVRVRSEGFPEAAMQKDDAGVWSFTSTPLPPDIYGYSFKVDGLRVLDLNNRLVKYNVFNSENLVHVPGKDLPWELNDVPHGVLHRHHYRSAAIGEEREVWIYTPPGYRAEASKKYPVLYLLHGYSDGEETWTTVGRANVILDNQIARGVAKPMLLVMPCGYGNRDIIATNAMVTRSPATEAARRDSFDKFSKSLATEIIPLVEKSYHVKSDAAHRAIAGLSMGGAQSLEFGLSAPERFGWIGAFSSGRTAGMKTFEEAFPALREKREQFHLIWLACGTEDDRVESNRNFHQWLTAQGVNSEWLELPGVHSFRVWRRCLAQFMPLLFR